MSKKQPEQAEQPEHDYRIETDSIMSAIVAFFPAMEYAARGDISSSDQRAMLLNAIRLISVLRPMDQCQCGGAICEKRKQIVDACNEYIQLLNNRR